MRKQLHGILPFAQQPHICCLQCQTFGSWLGYLSAALGPLANLGLRPRYRQIWLKASSTPSREPRLLTQLRRHHIFGIASAKGNILYVECGLQLLFSEISLRALLWQPFQHATARPKRPLLGQVRHRYCGNGMVLRLLRPINLLG